MATTTTQPYHIRPGRLSDIPSAVAIWRLSFAHDQLMDILFPNRHEDPSVLAAHVTRLFYSRWWTPNYRIDVLCRENGDGDGSEVVGLTWWKLPDSQLTFYERWISPFAWFSPIVRMFHSIRDYLFPVPNIDVHASHTFTRVFKDVEPRIRTTPRRREAWYLSTLAVIPSLQGRGLGTRLLLHGLERADEAGAATWLVGLVGIEGYYERHGFEVVDRANVGELSHWEGGAIMFRGDTM